jgi:hypothetical protein
VGCGVARVWYGIAVVVRRMRDDEDEYTERRKTEESERSVMSEKTRPD